MCQLAFSSGVTPRTEPHAKIFWMRFDDFSPIRKRDPKRWGLLVCLGVCDEFRRACLGVCSAETHCIRQTGLTPIARQVNNVGANV